MANSQSINFLKVKTKTEAEKKRIFLLRFVSIISLIVYCSVAGAIFLYSFSQENSLLKIEENLKKETQALERLEEVESLHVLLKQRLSFLRPILTEREIPFKSVFSYFDELLINGVSITDVVWHSPDIFEFSGVAENGVSLSSYLERLGAEVEVDKVDSVNLLSATRRKEGDYAFDIEVDLKQNQIK
ncbi:MAG: hypothetical protein ABIH88_02280 [Patescibacteria group bacterium]|nr:ELKS/Rab6-interacting/CAST family protein [Patescibacteria group bacterium]